MINRQIITIALGAALSVSASAEVLSPVEALARVNSNVGQISSRMAAPALTTAHHVLTINGADNIPALYIFRTTSGNAILSADDIAAPLLGFTDCPSDSMPAPMQEWMQFYADEIAAARTAAPRAASAYATIGRPERAPIEPLTTSAWYQNFPYNGLCPKIDGKATFTGCVATAMAQVLKTYRYPEQCSGGTFSYTANDKVGTLSLDFDQINLDWDNMLYTYTDNDGSTPDQRRAVATLMYALGVAAQTSFNTTSSGASTFRLGTGLVRNFGYDPCMQYRRRSWTTLYEWEEMIYSTLAEGHAVYYDGNTAAGGGHAFVVDGYRDNGYFHLNWGWNGLSDGYFLLSALNPNSQGIGGSNSGYNVNQGAYTKLMPLREGNNPLPVLTFCTDRITLGRDKILLGEKITVTTDNQTNGWYLNLTFGTTAGASFALSFTFPDGRVATLASLSTFGNYPPYGGIAKNFEITLPKGLPQGEYVVTPIVKSAAGNSPISQNFDNGVFTASIVGSEVIFHTSGATTAYATAVDTPDKITAGTTATVQCTLSNSTAIHYYDAVGLALVRKNPDSSVHVVTRFTPVAANVAPESTSDMTINCAVDKDLEDGDYLLCMLNSKDEVISDLYPVAIESLSSIRAIEETAGEATVTYFDLAGRRISNPRPGSVVLRRQGCATSKIIVK